MAKTEIINEIPEELDDKEAAAEGQEVELEKEVVEEPKEEPKKEAKAEPEFEIEEEDDTPKADRNRDPLPEQVKEELENDNLEEYSARVKERMAQLKKAWHDERRAKEAQEREREEAVRYAQQIINENNKLKQTLSTGEEDYLKTLKEKYETEVAVAQRDYREAHTNGDTDKLVEAQTRMTEAQYKLAQAQGMKPQYTQEALQQQQNSVNSEQAKLLQPRVNKPDDRAVAWQSQNTWFGKDQEMTSLALGLHEKLVSSGVDPSSDQYYRRIDETMHKRFPEYFGDTDSLEEDKPAQRKPSTVVAPATRSTGPKKIRLTKTQLALAKKFKLTPEQYARELIKTENANG